MVSSLIYPEGINRQVSGGYILHPRASGPFYVVVQTDQSLTGLTSSAHRLIG